MSQVLPAPSPPRLTEVPARPPYLGRLLELRADPLAMLTRLASAYGDYVRFRVLTERIVLVTHPDLVEELLVKHRGLERDRVTHSLRPVLGQGLLTAEGDHWKQQRARMAPSFSPRQVAGYGDVMVASARAEAAPTGHQNLHPYFSALTFDVVIRTLFGMAPGGEAAEVAPLLDSLMDAFEVENRTLWRWVPWEVPSPHRVRVRRQVARLHALMDGLIARARANPDARTLVARIMEARDETGAPMADAQLRDELLTMILAGHETTALTLTYAVWQLAEHPALQEELHAEI
ncbi:MAG: cytochrome P450, partial [Myxococcota bacterium]